MSAPTDDEVAPALADVEFVRKQAQEHEVKDYENQEARIGHDGRYLSVEDGEIVLTVPVIHGKLEIWFSCEEQRDLVDALTYFGAIK